MGRRLLRFVVNGAIVGCALLAMLGPAVVFLIALSWSLVTYIRSISLLVDLIHARNFGALGPQLHLLNVAARITLLSAGFFALVFALIVVYAGVLGRRGQRALLIPGLALVVPSIIAYLLGSALTGITVSPAMGIPLEGLAVFFVYVLFDAFALGVLLADTRAPVRRVRRFMRPRRYFLWQRMPYYSRRLQSRYVIFREALHEREQAPRHPALPEAAPAAAPSDGGEGSPSADEPPASTDTEATAGLTTVA